MSITTRRVFDSSTLPQGIDIGTQQSKSITVDNYSNFWLAIGTEGLFVPPHTLGWAASLWTSSASSVNVQRGVPTGVSQNATGNGAIVVTLYDTDIAPSPGVATTGLQGYAFTNVLPGIAALAPANVSLTGTGGAPADATQFWLEAIILTYEEDAGEPLPPVNQAVYICTVGALETTLMITPQNPVAQVDFHHLKIASAAVNGFVRAAAATDIEVTYIFSAM